MNINTLGVKIKKCLLCSLAFLSLFLLQSNITAENRTITVNGTTREYIIEVPSSYNGTVPHDLILVYHGMTGTAQQTTFTGFHNYGNTDKFITIYPQGLADIPNYFDPGTFTTGWKFEVSNNRDVTFTEVLLDSLNDEFTLNPNGVFVTGISNGGYFSDILACNIGDNLAAIAPVIGGTPLYPTSPCSITKILPVFHLGSEFDSIVDIENLRRATDYWVTHNNCDTAPVIEDICEVYYDNDQNDIVYKCEFACIVNGVVVTAKDLGCHTWPSTYNGYSFNTTDMVLDFFRKQGLGDTSSAIHSYYNFYSNNTVFSQNSLTFFSNKAILTFTLPTAGNVSLSIYTLNGSEVVELINNKLLEAGKHRVSIGKASLSNGTYVIKMQVDNLHFCNKMIVTW